MMEPAQDLSDGSEVPAALGNDANDLLFEQRTRRWFRSFALGAALTTLLALLLSMGAVVYTFTSEFHALALDAKVVLPGGPAIVVKTAPVSAPVRSASDAVAAPALEPTHAVVSLGSFTTSLVALVSAFVLAVTVLAIALVRASFTLTARGDEPGASPSPRTDDPGITLPTIEFVRAFGESLQTALKGVQGLAKTGD
jgi:hypothetical protein